ncbi:MAG: 50S ribosomal protein L21 [Chloroflexota bacterium]
MYAIIETGGRQYRTQVGKTFQTESLPYQVGETVVFDQVLLIAEGDSATVGDPVVAGASVKAVVTEQFKEKKIQGLKYRSGNRYRVRYGHRQNKTRLKVEQINTGTSFQFESSEEE